ncbi:LOW QUALITY PROTEIN: transmembrane protease serine 9-like [Rhopalosiphum maidis]|uniref:LOW QUALITY PROTEIN: transmembrane protease serine 9-like n=1 Tax=Rhopalosiphum maidis TaxID=43146 RepID=UPI000EFE4724|nr:LOW QUALITY PROTEIN: transmembrane protease serine 9-like [Rhopalosiphum maidis]
MRKELYFIFVTLMVGMITSLPYDGIIIFTDSIVSISQVKLTPSDLEFASKNNNLTKEKDEDRASKLPTQAMCGQRKTPSFRILGGSESRLGAWPWMVVLGYKNADQNKSSIEWLCGGTLISNTHVLTAATCATKTGKKVLTVARLGELDLDHMINDGAKPLDILIERIIYHEGYDTQKYTNNIALLVLKNSVTFNEMIQPICLPASLDMKKVEKSHNMPFIAGWGSINASPQNNEMSSTSLMEVQIPISNLTACKQTYATYKTVIDDKVICAGYPKGGKDSCRGDSGGPLMWSNRKQFYLIGIVSYGFKECGHPGYPGVYTKVTSYMDWILDNKIVFAIDSPKILNKSHEDISYVASKLPSQDTCGKRKAPSFRIVGGSDSDLGVWPWMVALGYKDKDDVNDSIKWTCGGTLISNKHVLSIARCLDNIGRSLLTVARLSDLNLNSTIDDGVTPLDVPIERVIQHKEYNKKSYTNDIGLVVLKNDITFTTFIQPICLPLSPDMKNIDMGNNLPFITGWGKTDTVEETSSSLKEVRVPIIDNEYCQWMIYRDVKGVVIDDRKLCAGKQRKNACQGDSGGPLMWLKEKQFYLIGISSFGRLFCDESPSVYTKVSSYIDWILENI